MFRVHGAGVEAAVAVRLRRCDEHVRAPVAVHVAAAGDPRPELVVRRRAVDAEAVRAEVGRVDRGSRAAAEDHIGGPGGRAPVVGVLRAHHHVGEPVPVHVAGTGGGPSEVVERGRAEDAEAAARGQRG
jgi:hypothetical protein